MRRGSHAGRSAGIRWLRASLRRPGPSGGGPGATMTGSSSGSPGPGDGSPGPGDGSPGPGDGSPGPGDATGRLRAGVAACGIFATRLFAHRGARTRVLVGVAAAVLGGGVAAAVVFGGLSGGQAATGGQVPPNQAYVAPPATATVQIPPGGFTAATGRPAAPPQAARKRPPAPRAPIAVQAVTTAAFGPVLAADGRTLYRLTPRTHQLTCVGACPAGWRALLLAPGQAVQLAPDLIGQVGTITLPNGSTQVTYNGVPLYLFTGDQAEGEANGAGGRWEVVRPR